jgi:hypothetical protein
MKAMMMMMMMTTMTTMNFKSHPANVAYKRSVDTVSNTLLTQIKTQQQQYYK